MSKLVIFDCDGTLVDSEIIAAEVFPSVWSAMGLEMTTDYFLCHFVGTGSDAEVVKKTMALLPPDAMDIADRKFEEELALRLQAVRGIPQVVKGLSFQSCVASNSSLNYIKNALAKTLLAEFFEGRVYSSHDLGKPKPAPDIFLHAASELGFSPAQCVVVEDSLSGIKGAQNAGMSVIGFMGGLHCNSVVRERIISAEADYYCSSAEELSELLRSLSK
ncbi:HAD-IA family hydrolase [Mesorhizobium sp. M1423]|uniref:HAD family hydrolase n=1 Tax=Mesorhizobium sp. M1423 TaxID=2957101 RepID=UPI0033393AF5